MRTFIAASFLLLTLGVGSSALAAGPYDKLLVQVPPEANLLVLIDAERIRASAFVEAQRLNSDDPGQLANHSFVPPREIQQAVLAAKLRGFRESMVDWQTALLNLKDEPSLTGFAASYQGTIEQLGQREYVAMPNDSMALAPGNKVLAVLTPVDRKRATQAFALSATKPQPKFTEYLTKIVATSGLKSDAVIAIDLEDLFAQSRILAYLQASKTFQKPPVDALKAARLLQSMQGFALRLKFTDAVNAEITIDFSKPTTDAGEWTKDLLLEVLSDVGATVEDLESWSYAKTDRQVTFTGSLSLTGLRRVFSMLDFPTVIPEAYDPNVPVTPEESQKRIAKATLARFKATQKMIDDLKNPTKTAKLSTGEYGMWYDNYAKKIEGLPSLNVDPDLLAYCDDVVLRLRVMATQFRMVGIQAGQASRTTNRTTSYFFNWYGGSYTGGAVSKAQRSEHDNVERVERAAAAGDKVAQLQEIDNATTQIRRTMTQRYQLEF